MRIPKAARTVPQDFGRSAPASLRNASAREVGKFQPDDRDRNPSAKAGPTREGPL